MINEIINGMATHIGNIIVTYGAFGVFIASIIEEVIAPIPSSVVVLSSSFFLMNDPTISLLSLEKLFFLVALPAACGVSLGSLFFYGIAYYAAKPFICRFGKYLGVSWQDIEKLEEKFQKTHADEILLLALRIIPITPSIAVNIFYGFIRYDVKKFVIITFLGTLIRVFTLGFLGWQFGNFYQYASTQISLVEKIAVLGLIIATIIFVFYLHKNAKNK